MRSSSQINPKWTKRWRAVAASATVTLACGLLIAGGDQAGAADVGELRVDNPYAGARVYVNPEWSAKAAAEPGGSRDRQPADRRLAGPDRRHRRRRTARMGLRAHLDEALAAGRRQLVIQLVIYNLPGRDCAALASNGELGPTEIDQVQDRVHRPDRRDPGRPQVRRPADRRRSSRSTRCRTWSPTPAAGPPPTPQCDTMKANGNYVNGVGYALAKLGADPERLQLHRRRPPRLARLGRQLRPLRRPVRPGRDRRAAAPSNNVHGFITNTANYSRPEGAVLHRQRHRRRHSRSAQSKWVDWNRYVDELSFAQAFRSELVTAGFTVGHRHADRHLPQRLGRLRPARPAPAPRPTSTPTSTVGRIDRRIHPGNWCNQSGAGLGERPQAAPAAGIDAYVWIKPPGESDGASTAIPNDEGKGFDRMCDPTYDGQPRNGNNMSGALPNAPLSGHWFSAQFQQLMQNAYPPL